MVGTSVLEFDVPEDRATTDVPTLPFRINGEDFVMVMPKLADTAAVLAVLLDEDNINLARHGAQLARTLLGLVNYVQREDPDPETGKLRGRARIYQRLNNPDDALDLESIAPIFKACVQAMFNRPTGPLVESSEQRENTGSDSEAVSLDKSAATSSA